MTINELLNESILLELPHISLDRDHAVDLELEIHSGMSITDYINYIDSWIHSRPVPSKTKGLVMRVGPDSMGAFIKKLLKHELFHLFTRKHYGEDVWDQVRELLLQRLAEINR